MPAKPSAKRPAGGNDKNSNKRTKTSSAPQRQRKHADVVEEAKGLWNKLRMKSNSPEQKRQILDDLIPLIRGKACQIALQHDASRVVQAAIQFGTPEERSSILKELLQDGNTTFMDLCKSQYGHFLVLKVIKYCHKVDGEAILKTFRGQMTKLAVHVVSSRVVEALFTTFSAKQMASLKQEFYGPHFSLFAHEQTPDDKKDKNSSKDLPSLKRNLELLPDKKDKTIAAVASVVNKGASKSLYGLSFYQELLFEYLSAIDPKDVRAFSATAEIVHLFSSRPGSQAAALIISYGTAKDRKRILKSLKGYTRSALLHHDAYLAICRLVQLTDDTVSVQKNLLNEILKTASEEQEESPLLELALSKTASKLFRMLLGPQYWQKLFDPYEHSVLFPNPCITEKNGESVPTSRKDDAVRRQELLKHLREPLEQLCVQHTAELLQSQPGSFVLRDTYATFRTPSVVTAVLEVLKEKPDLLQDFYGHLGVKNLILSDVKEDEDKAMFSTGFLKAFEQELNDVCKSNRGAFVVEALCKVEVVKAKVKKTVNKGSLKKRTKGEGATAGFKALVTVLAA